MPGFGQLRPERIVRERTTSMASVTLQTTNLWLVGLGYTLLWWALLLWANLNPGSLWFASTAAASPASQIMCASAILTPFFIPFVVYFPVTQTKSHSSKTTGGSYVKQVLACTFLTSIPLLSVCVLFALMSWLGFLTKDLVTPIIFGRPLLIFVLSLTLLTSTSAIGLAMSTSRSLHLVATAVAVSTVTLPFILSKLVTGSTFESHLVTLVQGVGRSTVPSIFVLLSSLLVGSSFAWLYGSKQW